VKYKLSENIQPENGAVKTLVKYAWLPKRVANTLIWFEQYEELYVYQEKDIQSNIVINDKAAKFTVGEWIKVSEKLIKWVDTTTG